MMSTRKELNLKPDSMVWVWDSTWLPAVVVDRACMGRVLVRLEHGVTFSASITELVPRDPVFRGGGKPLAAVGCSDTMRSIRK